MPPSPSCCPTWTKEELYWRLDIVAGALTYAMADFGVIKRKVGVNEQTPPRALR